MAIQGRSHRSLDLRLQARPEYVAILRAHIRAWLEDVSASDREIFDVLTAATEAFVNAVEHPHQPTSHLVDVKGSFTDGCVTISIRDYGTWQGERAHKEEGGLGLVMIDALMDAVRVNCKGDGTIITMRRRLAMD